MSHRNGTASASPSDRGADSQTPGGMLLKMLWEGRSFSARERNCCFLNTGGGRRFANISAVSGLDLPDDGRAVAQVDWDFDGDVDLWIANRSGPLVRCLRNDGAAGHHYLALRLSGRQCNRDAVGARVEVHPNRGDQARPLIKTLRAGEGFLAQSSKWLNFGLGQISDIERVIVRWPGGKAETFTGLKTDRRYELVEGSGQGRVWNSPAPTARLTPSEITFPISSKETLSVGTCQDHAVSTS